MHWKSLKGLGGNMKHIARFTVNLCDFMNGYIGKMLADCIVIMATELVTITIFFTMAIVLS